MITLKQWMEVADYRITEGSEYMWDCYGSNAYRLDSWNGDQDGHSVSITFDTKTQEVYEVSAYDYKNQRAYRLINPIYVKKFKKESKHRNIDFNEAWDNVTYTDLETVDDYVEKAQAIVAGEDYDARVEMPLVLDSDQLFELMKVAHSRDITLNELVEDVLQDAISKERANVLPKFPIER
jgi:hypothetical protein